MKVKSLSHVRLLATPWTAAYQAPPLMGFSRQEYWSGLPLPSPKILPRVIHFCLISLAFESCGFIFYDTNLGIVHACMLRCFSRVRLFATLWTVALLASLSMGFSRQEYRLGCHALLQGIFLIQGLKLCLLYLLHWQTGSLPLHYLGSPITLYTLNIYNFKCQLYINKPEGKTLIDLDRKSVV